MRDLVQMVVAGAVMAGLALLVVWPYRVSGNSMEPKFHDGQWLVINKMGRPKIGDVVVFKYQNTELLKRIIRPVDNGFWVEGDNKDFSTDSREFGPVPKIAIVGKAMW